MNKKILTTLLLGLFLFSFTSASVTTFNNSLSEEVLSFSGDENITRYLKVQDGSYFNSGSLDISGNVEGTYTGESFSTSSSGNNAPVRITNNKTYIWIVDSSDDEVYKYWMNGTYTGESFDTNAIGNVLPKGITNNNTYIWVSDEFESRIYKYWMNGTYTGESFSTTGSGSAFPGGITNDGTYFYITDSSDDEVYKYWMNGTYTGESFDTNSIGNSLPGGITNDGTYIWINDNADDEVYKYWMNGTYTGESFEYGGGNVVTGITNDGTYFYMSDMSDDEVDKYWMSVATTNPSLYINNNNIWNYTGNYSITETTSDLSSIINNYISTTTPVSGYYYIPFIFHSSSIGILEYSNLLFTSYGYELNSIFYDSSVLSTSTNTFNINITYDTNEYELAQASLWYNGLEYTSTKTTGGITALFSNDIQVPTVETEQNYTFYWTLSLTNSSGTYDYNISEYYQIVSPVILHFCDETYNVTAINFSLKEEGTFDTLNGSLEATFEYWVSGLSGVYQEYSFSDTSGTNSSFAFCISPGNENFTADATISYYNSEYERREYLLDDYAMNNETQNISLYLSPTNVTDVFTFTVKDENSNTIDGATIRVQRWDIGTNNFYTVGMVYTSSDGTGIINLRLNDAWYRYQVLYGGDLYLTTDPVKESGTSRLLEITLEESNPYQQFGEIDYSITYNNETNVTVFVFSDSTGALATGCLEVLEVTGSGNSQDYYSCVESTSGTLSYKINGTGTYIIRGIFILSDAYDNVQKVVDEIIIQGTQERFEVMGSFGQFISLMLVGTAAFLGIAIGSIPLGLAGIIVSLIGSNLIGWLNISATVLYGLVSIVILIVINLRSGR